MTQAASILDKQKAILAGKITVGVNKVSPRCCSAPPRAKSVEALSRPGLECGECRGEMMREEGGGGRGEACGAARGCRDAERGAARALRKCARSMAWDGADPVEEQVKWGFGPPWRGNRRGAV